MIDQTTLEKAGKELVEGERFRIKNRLGMGGIGVVYEAFDTKTKERVAIKTLLNVSSRAIERFEKEFFALKDVKHPNLVGLKEFFRDKAQCFYSMELIEGKDFLSYVRSRSDDGFDERKLRHCLGQLVEGVSFLHRIGKVHRDLKPSNILVTRDARLAILDFGLVTDVIGGYQLRDIEASGTPAYMSPEQSIGNPVSAATDWYSVGVLLYQAMAGRLPYEGSSAQLRIKRFTRELPPPTEFASNLPADLVALCLDMLNYDPEKRPGRHEIFDRLGLEYPWEDEGGFNLNDAEVYVDNIPYVGRAGELESLHDALQKHREGRVNHILILGEPGLGKTALVKEFINQSKEKTEELVVLSGKFSPNSERRYQAFDEVVSELSENLFDILRDVENGAFHKPENIMLTPAEASAVTKVFPSLMRVRIIADTATRESRQPGSLKVRVDCFRGLGKLLALLVSQRPLIVFLDDVQWAKTDSLDMLRELQYVDESEQPLFIMTMRSKSSLQPAVESIFANLNRLELAALPESDMLALAKLICRRFGAKSWQESHISTLVREAEGHPLFLAELIRHVVTSGEDIGARRLEDTILSRIQLLDEDSRRILEIVCLAGVNIDLEMAAEVADMDLGDCAKVLTNLVTRNLVRTYVSFGHKFILPYHDRVREVVTENIEEKAKKDYHRRLASALSYIGNDIERAIIVRHLEAGGSAKQAAAEARMAAKVAANSLAFGQVVDLLRIALRLSGREKGARKNMLMDLGDALCNIGRGAEASMAYLEAREGSDCLTRYELWGRAAEQLILSGHFEEGLDELRLALGAVGEKFSRSHLRALLSLLWTRALLKFRGLGWKYKSEAEIDRKKLVRLDIYKVAGENLGPVDFLLGAKYQARSLLEALRAGEISRVGHVMATEATFVATQGTERSFRRARILIGIAEKISKEYHLANLKFYAKLSMGTLRYFEGFLKDSGIYLEEAEEGLVELSDTSTFQLNSTRFFRLFTLKFTGDFLELRERSEKYLRDAARRGDKYAEANTRFLRSQIWLAQDRPEDAIRDMNQVVWAPPEGGGYHLQHWYGTIALSELWLYTGIVNDKLKQFEDAFQALEKSMLIRIGPVRAESSWLKCRMMLAAASTSSKREFGHLLKEIRCIAKKISQKKTGFRQADVWALLLRAAVADQQGETESAIRLLQNAITQAEEKESPQLKAAAKRRLGQILGGEAGDRLIAKADEWMSQKGIRNAAAMTEVFAPGFNNR